MSLQLCHLGEVTDMSSNPENKINWAGLCFVWLIVLAAGVGVYKFFVAPRHQKAKEQVTAKEHEDTIKKTSSSSRYNTSVSFAGDGFSGYAPIRSDMFKDECGKAGIRVEYKDDGANYTQRLKDIADGKTDMAVFTVDALFTASAVLGDFPASIVCVNDESRGADALIAAGKRYPNIDAMNNPDTKIVCVKNSPSEFLARVIIAHFSLDRLSANPFDFGPVDKPHTAEDVYQQYKQSKITDNFVYVLWEPYVSKVVSNPDYHVLIDTSKFRGYVTDVIIANRGFIIKHEPTVEAVVKAHLTTIFNRRNDMLDMVVADAKITGDALSSTQAERLVKSIWWKNTQENFGHFGFTRVEGLQSLEDICRNITDVLIKTSAISKDPTDGKFNMWYYDGIMKKLFDSNWHPGFGNESIRTDVVLKSLKDEDWSLLRPVGTLQVPRLVFSRGTNKLTSASEATLAELSEKLKTFPSYYLTVKGHASSGGDVEANLKLASERADVAVEWLSSHGVDRARIRSESATPNGSTTVAFVLGELPY